MEKKLVGFKRFTSKKGNPLCVAVIESPFSEADNQRGSFGCDCETVFLPSEQYSYLTIKDIGKNVKLNWDIVNGRAYLRELVVLSEPKA